MIAAAEEYVDQVESSDDSNDSNDSNDNEDNNDGNGSTNTAAKDMPQLDNARLGRVASAVLSFYIELLN